MATLPDTSHLVAQVLNLLERQLVQPAHVRQLSPLIALEKLLQSPADSADAT